jgi:hypothetical protein
MTQACDSPSTLVDAYLSASSLGAFARARAVVADAF